MATLGTLYRKYLRGSELKGPATVEIVAVSHVTVRPHPQAEPIEKWCLWVKGLPQDTPNGILIGPKAEEQLVGIFGPVDVNQLRGKPVIIAPKEIRVAGQRRTTVAFSAAPANGQVRRPAPPCNGQRLP